MLKDNISRFDNLVQKFNEQISAFETKPTKAESKRLRDTMNQMQKLAVAAKKDLIEMDTEGYKS